MKTDIEIAREAKLKPSEEIAAKVGIDKHDLVCYGETIAKIKDYQKYIKN